METFEINPEDAKWQECLERMDEIRTNAAQEFNPSRFVGQPTFAFMAARARMYNRLKDLLGENFTDSMHPEIRDRIAKEAKRIVNEGFGIKS